MNTLNIDTPLGEMYFCAEDSKITALRFGRTEKDTPCEIIYEAKRQLAEYFNGKRQEFDLPLAPKGTPFQQAVWQALREIPYGETASYGEIAAKVGNPKASRAVGMANNRNPIAIIVPCHRVVGANGSLTGYAGGLGKKDFLLSLEHNNLK